MTRQHFEALAAEIKAIPVITHRVTAAYAVARAVRQFNPAFDLDRFLTACGAQP